MADRTQACPVELSLPARRGLEKTLSLIAIRLPTVRRRPGLELQRRAAEAWKPPTSIGSNATGADDTEPLSVTLLDLVWLMTMKPLRTLSAA